MWPRTGGLHEPCLPFPDTPARQQGSRAKQSPRCAVARSAAKHIAPTIKYETVPCDPPLRIIDCVPPEIVRALPIPGDDAVVYRIVQDGGFCWIEILHRTQVWRRNHAAAGHRFLLPRFVEHIAVAYHFGDELLQSCGYSVHQAIPLTVNGIYGGVTKQLPGGYYQEGWKGGPPKDPRWFPIC